MAQLSPSTSTTTTSPTRHAARSCSSIPFEVFRIIQGLILQDQISRGSFKSKIDSSDADVPSSFDVFSCSVLCGVDWEERLLSALSGRRTLELARIVLRLREDILTTSSSYLLLATTNRPRHRHSILSLTKKEQHFQSSCLHMRTLSSFHLIARRRGRISYVQ
ncbi:hypothetical protein SCHPADRAFT_569297 [Schizopora paradoxa]|uniref:Uncharacterized protein n=1 Tax=Schizopora paradoxa TaxID=27342 RepID=A0A0H2RIU0_9AGAM|nr:hypothetical protein SCHPADRAFT_569297 [Schizopora paradoxa]